MGVCVCMHTETRDQCPMPSSITPHLALFRTESLHQYLTDQLDWLTGELQGPICVLPPGCWGYICVPSSFSPPEVGTLFIYFYFSLTHYIQLQFPLPRLLPVPPPASPLSVASLWKCAVGSQTCAAISLPSQTHTLIIVTPSYVCGSQPS